jgi:hypothetical protein
MSRVEDLHSGRVQAIPEEEEVMKEILALLDRED